MKKNTDTPDSTASKAPKHTLNIPRTFSSDTVHPYDDIEWSYRTAEITDDKGKAIFKQDNIEVPAAFSDLAAKILSSKYFYGDIDNGTDPLTNGRESSFKQVVDRVAGTITKWGLKDGYFKDKEQAQVFDEELKWLLVNQYGAFNSPVWFNLGLYENYGVGKDSGKGNYYWDQEHDVVMRAESQYEYPQCSACFIQHVDDDMDSIMDLAKAEAMLFKFGSGSGTDLSSIRSTREKLSGGGKPSGPLSFLSVYDAVAGVVKSGGKTRRAAKMNVLKDWHPDIEEFIEAKQVEERKAWALIEQGYDPSFNGDAYGSIKYQNENLSIRTSDEFMQSAIDGNKFYTRRVTDGQPCEEKDSSYLLDKIAEGTHICGDPGMQFDDTIHKWHTCKGSGRQNCTNPCSEYLFLDNSACNLASLNLMKFRTPNGLDAERFAAAAKIFIIAQEIVVDRSSYPTEGITYNSHWFRTLGLGYANLGALLMSYGYAYASDSGLGLAKAITAAMTGIAYKTSAELAALKGPFAGYHEAAHYGVPNPPEADNVASMQGVIALHKSHAESLDHNSPKPLVDFAVKAWKEASDLGKRYGFRNAQVTVLAPTGTIGFLMDCDTTGVEPAIGLVAYKTLAGGGMMTIPIKSIPLAMETMGYNQASIDQVCNHVKEYGTVENIKVNGKELKSGLKDEHMEVFDSAFRSGHGKRYLHYTSHIDMMSAVQPFLSGAISKTVNIPQEATIKEIREVYIHAWKKGIKGIAIYRDGSKRSAPIKTTKDVVEEKKPEVQVVTEPYRRKLPDTRQSITHKFSLGGTEGYITVGKFDDGTAGEVFIQMAKAGSTINGLMDTVGTLVSLCLQYGVPLETLVKKFSHVRFEPEGMTKNPHIPFAKSVIDYVARELGMEFIPGYKEKMSPLAQMDDAFEHQNPSSSTIEKEAPKLDEQQLELLTQSEGNLTCPECGSGKVKVTGTCACCLNCGTSLGCS
ncbi:MULTISPECIES: vitamin B12-dependent ribonucleotide reductase [unclassified Lentimonas]|uniref:vitamin B12-dependent ribonucleotide reductase n=1 Tax=unclassified Lentimonas TaxID=2630993 RepID=UPI001323C4DB|nr:MULTISPECIES: vitamin B12-dependent ribonucleotide reductase [unclassified Lentimonas]CAA6679194.1 Ribonucleotide reductase of class II (coenzyme B12-dependent) (EC [Lentimonas sp. CC4]CAA6684062.1 Ribonucleotide reductase of class II (coenzyme B12-dependent) (EC [Lentimonas sp. CC6]CAA6689825.1 Ribonucleotide reductase of class II (coenzyme B12-dependent) (EC [Lentimonas sp. CC10]CAA6694837.1 Ribonucleotide reductase of class II (coenzyme B12-dependent) (EC [Lentimonas sp. CC19]CAA7069476.